MKKQNTSPFGRLAAATVLTLGLVAAAQAEEPTWFGDKQAAGRWLVGLKWGTMKNEGTELGDATNIGFVFGYQFARPVGTGAAAIEFEFTDSTDEGSIGAESFLGTTGDWELQSKALYFVYRTGGDVYFKGKAGFVIADIKYKTPAQVIEDEESQASVSGGIGFRLTDSLAVEFEYTGSIGINDINYINGGLFLNF